MGGPWWTTLFIKGGWLAGSLFLNGELDSPEQTGVQVTWGLPQP